MALSQFGIAAVWAGIACSFLGLVGWTEDPMDPAAPRMAWAGAFLMVAGAVLTVST